MQPSAPQTVNGDLAPARRWRVFLKKILVFSVNAPSYFGRIEMSVVIDPSCRQETKKFDGSSLRPKG